VPAHISGEAFASDTADLSADHLDRAHERIGQKQSPNQAVTELGPRLGIGGDAARIVIRGAGDEPGPENIG